MESFLLDFFEVLKLLVTHLFMKVLFYLLHLTSTLLA